MLPLPPESSDELCFRHQLEEILQLSNVPDLILEMSHASLVERRVQEMPEDGSGVGLLDVVVHDEHRVPRGDGGIPLLKRGRERAVSDRPELFMQLEQALSCLDQVGGQVLTDRLGSRQDLSLREQGRALACEKEARRAK